MLMADRIIQGFCCGLNFPLRAVIIGECTSPKYRGAFLMFISLGNAQGILFVHFIGSIFDWRITALMCMAFSFTGLIMTIYLPESPSYLAAKGKIDKCKKVFRRLRGDKEEVELEEMIKARCSDKTQGSFKDNLVAFERREFYLPLIIMIHTYALGLFSGTVVLNVYTPLITQMIIGTEVNISFWVVVFDIQRLIGNCVAIYIVQKLKRRTMLFISGSISVASHFAIAGYVFARNRNLLLYDAVWIPVTLITIQVLINGAGMLTMPNVLAGEIFPFRYRGIAGSISVVSVSLFSFTILKTFYVLTSLTGIDGVYAINGMLLTYFLTVIWFLLPETKGKTLQQIEDRFMGNNKGLNKEQTPLNIKTENPEKDDRKMSLISHDSFVAV